MSQAPKDTRTPAEKVRDTAGIIGSFKHEGYVPNPEDEAHSSTGRAGAKSRPKKLSRYFANALLSGSGRRRRASVRNPARGVGLWEPVESTRPLGASQFKVALLPAMGRIMTELKTPLDERALDRLMLATDAAVVAYQEQRLKLEAARKARNNQQKADLAQTQTGGDNEIA